MARHDAGWDFLGATERTRGGGLLGTLFLRVEALRDWIFLLVILFSSHLLPHCIGERLCPFFSSRERKTRLAKSTGSNARQEGRFS